MMTVDLVLVLQEEDLVMIKLLNSTSTNGPPLFSKKS